MSCHVMSCHVMHSESPLDHPTRHDDNAVVSIPVSRAGSTSPFHFLLLAMAAAVVGPVWIIEIRDNKQRMWIELECNGNGMRR